MLRSIDYRVRNQIKSCQWNFPPQRPYQFSKRKYYDNPYWPTILSVPFPWLKKDQVAPLLCLRCAIQNLKKNLEWFLLKTSKGVIAILASVILSLLYLELSIIFRKKPTKHVNNKASSKTYTQLIIPVGEERETSFWFKDNVCSIIWSWKFLVSVGKTVWE